MPTKYSPLSFHLSRRQVLKGAGATAGAFAAGSLIGGSLKSAEELLNPAPVKAATFYKGCDISWAQQMANYGYFWKNASDQGTTGSADTQINYLCSILKSYNINAIRLRTWVNPSTDPVNGCCNQADTVAMAYLMKEMGLPVDIDFHFGDTWNSVGTQNPPAAWANMTLSQMESALGTYVYNFMEALKASGVTPTWVQLGNEINSGICHPLGGVNYPSQMTALLMAGYNNVKAVFPSAQCIIHLAQPQDSGPIETFMSAYDGNGGKLDILGFSSYGSSSLAVSLANDMLGFGKTYGKPVMQVEFGGPVSSSGTATAATEYIQTLRNGGGLGVFYWEPECYSPFCTYTEGAWETTEEPDTAIMNAIQSA
ncbi:MAG: glycosyl hydrolase 53 family protein [Terracidiphilus sp.]